MATWNELFLDDKHRAVLPQPEIYKFSKKVGVSWCKRWLKAAAFAPLIWINSIIMF